TFVDGSGRYMRLKAEHKFSPFVLSYFGCYIPTTSTFFRGSLLDGGALRINEEYHYVMDFELFMHLSKSGVRFHWLPQTLAAFRWHEQNKSLDSAKRIAERMLVQDAYCIRPKSLIGRRVAYALARVIHVAMKFASGSLARQRNSAQLEGKSLLWWDRVRS
ncbi:MAG: hypothetical protein KJ747_00400, partial [Actinobacteria bacterium]|nr:hypothetical protein [Actinomycetota bacterium]